MNITINLSTANLEIVNSNIISKLYNLISGNSLHNVILSGNLYSAKGYKLLIDTLVDRFSPNLIITVPVEGQYLIFTDSALETALRSTIGDGEGITLAALKNANPNSSLGLKNNTNIVDARELCLVEGTDTNGGCITGCTNLKILGIPYKCTYFNPDWGKLVAPEKIVVKDMLNWVKTSFNGGNINRDNGWDLYITLDGVNIEKVENLTLPEGGIFSGSENNSPFYACKSIKNITVPASYTIIRGFHNSSIESLTFLLDSLLTDIGYLAFRDCTNLVFNVANIPLTVTNISEKAFKNCSGVTGILNLPNLISLSNLAFFASPITGATNLGSITLIPNNCFLYSALQSITLPSTCTTIKGWGLSNMTTLTTVSEGSGLTTIEGYAFYDDTNLTSVAGLSNVTAIGESAFEKCTRLTGTLNLPNITEIGASAFAGTSITAISNLENLTLMGVKAFSSCTSLVSADLSNITYFGWGSFSGCSNLVLDVATLSTNTTFIGEYTFNECTKVTGVLNLPNLARMDSNAFRATGITSITSLGNLTSTPAWGFQHCRSLTSVTLPSGLTTIGRNCFENDSSLTSINLNNVTVIETSGIGGCSSLIGTLNLPNLTSLGEYALWGTTGITEINLRNSLVTSIPKGVFSSSGAKRIHFPKTVITLQNLWYDGMPSLDKFTGLDNIQTHPMIVGIIENGNIKNPIAFKKITGVDQYLVRASNRNNTSVHSLFLPKMQITYSSNEEVLSTPKSTEFTYLSLGLGATSFKLLYYKDIQTFGLGTFYYTNIDNLVINNTTVPTYDTTNLSNFTSGSTLYNNLSSLFGGAVNIGTIWVPNSAISTYQASPLFSGMTIKGIDTKTNGTDYDLPRFATLEDWESAAAIAEANSQSLPVGLIEEYM